jgi:hypothetical protein
MRFLADEKFPRRGGRPSSHTKAVLRTHGPRLTQMTHNGYSGIRFFWNCGDVVTGQSDKLNSLTLHVQQATAVFPYVPASRALFQ